MPVTSLALLIFSVLAAGGLTIWALNAWGLVTVVPMLLCLALILRWALADTPYDDGQA
ncbi:hypothetical protein [Cognatishimia sp. F0-27]|uniref:hypothetical protein n=1 Tax=Cognatishimia sp. F0-27 TaxID=2816855 RepID=UPI001D0C5EAE|nr:hypothetical protein [Cognatishimia sp. F0-27]MCC1492553.1 hypothetical protein [Cognatishimia sp. F0-27]